MLYRFVMPLLSKNCIRINEKGEWIEDYAPNIDDIITHRVRKTLQDVVFYYANLIAYIRLVICFISLSLIIGLADGGKGDPQSWINIIIAILILGISLLDWIACNVASYFGELSVIGTGLRWLGDIFSQFCLAFWCMIISDNIYLKLFAVMFMCMETSIGLFDFAVSAQSIYPISNDYKNPPWYTIVDKSRTNNKTYNYLGILCRLANTLYQISLCLKVESFIIYALAPFVFHYIWQNAAHFLLIVANWKETTSKLHRQGIEFVRECTQKEVELLQESYNATKPELIDPDEISWLNLYTNGKFHKSFENSKLKNAMEEWTRNLVVENFPNESDRVILSYGFLYAPKHGKTTQEWHIDYYKDVSNLFIPLSELTLKNATQFIRGPLNYVRTHNIETGITFFPEPNVLMDLEKANHLEVCQIVSKPFNLLKMYPCILHHGIANGEDYDRILFFLSTNPKFINLGEVGQGNKFGDYKVNGVLSEDKN